MAEYKITSEGSRKYTLTGGEQALGTLAYEKCFSLKATITLANNAVFRIEPKGFWETTIEVKSAETVLLDFKMNWHGYIVIDLKDTAVKRDFVLKPKGILKNDYRLLDRDKQELLAVSPSFKWNRFDYDYLINTSDAFEQLPLKQVLLLTVVHCINYYTSMVSAALAAST